jgi:hypothetical protein
MHERGERLSNSSSIHTSRGFDNDISKAQSYERSPLVVPSSSSRGSRHEIMDSKSNLHGRRETEVDEDDLVMKVLSLCSIVAKEQHSMSIVPFFENVQSVLVKKHHKSS